MTYALVGLAYVVVLGLLAAALLLARDRIARAIWNWRNPPEKLAAIRRDFEARLSKPDWTFYEGHLERKIPDALRTAYSDLALLRMQGLKHGDLYIGGFEPLDRQGLADARAWLPFDAVPFASSDGNLIYLRAGPQESNAVYITYHDGGDTELIAPDIATFLSDVRRAHEDA
jgi:hypothetical protein